MNKINDNPNLAVKSGYTYKVLQQHLKNEIMQQSKNNSPNDQINITYNSSKKKNTIKDGNFINEINNHLKSNDLSSSTQNKPKRHLNDCLIQNKKRPEMKIYTPPSRRNDDHIYKKNQSDIPELLKLKISSSNNNHVIKTHLNESSKDEFDDKIFIKKVISTNSPVKYNKQFKEIPTKSEGLSEMELKTGVFYKSDAPNVVHENEKINEAKLKTVLRISDDNNQIFREMKQNNAQALNFDILKDLKAVNSIINMNTYTDVKDKIFNQTNISTKELNSGNLTTSLKQLLSNEKHEQVIESLPQSPLSSFPTMLLVKDSFNREKMINLPSPSLLIESSPIIHNKLSMSPRCPPFHTDNSKLSSNTARRSLSFSEDHPSSFQFFEQPRIHQMTLSHYPVPRMVDNYVGRRPISPILYNEREPPPIYTDYHDHRFYQDQQHPSTFYTPTPFQQDQVSHNIQESYHHHLGPPPTYTHDPYVGHDLSRVRHLSTGDKELAYRDFAIVQRDQPLESKLQQPSPHPNQRDVRNFRREMNNWLGNLNICDKNDSSVPSVVGVKFDQNSPLKNRYSTSLRRNSNRESDYSSSSELQRFTDPEELITDKLERVVEVTGFPLEFKTVDLRNILISTGDNEMDIIWVDDDHALAVFTSAHYATEAVSISHPLLKCKPYEQSCAKSKAKAEKSLDGILANMMPYKPRPLTTVIVARRFIEGHLGVKSNLSPALRLREARSFKEAIQEKRKAEDVKKIDLWDIE